MDAACGCLNYDYSSSSLSSSLTRSYWRWTIARSGVGLIAKDMIHENMEWSTVNTVPCTQENKATNQANRINMDIQNSLFW